MNARLCALAALLLVATPAIAAKVVDADALRAWITANERDEVVILPPPPPPETIPGPVGITGNWTLTFNDEFTGTAINAAKWNLNWFGAPGQVTNAVNSFEVAAYDPAQCSVANGELLKAAKAKPNTVTVHGKTYQYVTCFTDTRNKFEQTYGVFEARIWMPGPTTAGSIPWNWGGWWGNGWHVDHPDHGEIDVVENLSGGPIPHYHFGNPDINWSSPKPTPPAGGWQNGWHVYSVKWQADRASFYYDGVWIGTVTVADPFPKYWSLAYNLGAGAGGPLNVPQTQRVDYIRVWRPT